MARSPRLQIPHLIRHVMSRGNGRMEIFLDDTDYRQFVHLLGEVMEDSSIPCWNYCVMPNHYHLTIQPSLPNLSEALRRLNSSYAQWWNRRHGRVGHVFQGRFKDQIVDRETYLLTLSRYVVLNPVRAGLVSSAEAWRWSSYAAVAGLIAAPSFVVTASTLQLFGTGPDAILRNHYVHFINAAADDHAIFERIRSNDRVLGSRTFKETIRSRARNKPAGT